MDEGADLRKYLDILTRRKWVVLGIFLLTLTLGMLLSFVTQPIYEASILLFPATSAEQPQSFPLPSSPSSSQGRPAINPYEFTHPLSEIAQSEAFVRETVERLGVDASSLRVRAQWVPDSLDVRLTVRANTPGTAQRVSEALATSLVQMSEESNRPLHQTLERLLEQARADTAYFGRVAAEARTFSNSLQKRTPTVEALRIQAVALEAMTAADRNYQTARDKERGITLQIAAVHGVRVIGSRAVEVTIAPRRHLNMTVSAALGLLGGILGAFAAETLSTPRASWPPALKEEARR